jgi:protein-L-isoaspartate(D-aspartate) O-methyltransferase
LASPKRSITWAKLRSVITGSGSAASSRRASTPPGRRPCRGDRGLGGDWGHEPPGRHAGKAAAPALRTTRRERERLDTTVPSVALILERAEKAARSMKAILLDRCAMRTLLKLLFALWFALAFPVSTRAQDDRSAERDEMIAAIQEHAQQAAPAVPDGRIDPAVLQAMRTVPRHEFVPEDVRAQAYLDQPVPIGFGQTISQPFIVALMTDLLDVGADHKVLEIGTGSGYQAAVLSPLVAEVYSVEIIPELGERATAALQRLGFANVRTKVADGYYGWPEAAPFDGIVVTAAASQIPPPLVEQLKPGGRMVIPVGGAYFAQQLMLVEKGADGKVTTRQLLPVQFVPLTRAETQ